MLFHNKNTQKERRVPLVPIPGRFTSLLNYYIKQHGERAALCTSASLTAEAAVILPLFLLAILSFISVMNVCQTQITAQAELAEKAKKMSMYAYLADDYMNSEYIDLAETKTYRLEVSLVPLYRVNLALRGRVHTWTGRSEGERRADAENIFEEMVYVTDNQSVYHTDSHCSYLDLSIRGVQKEDLSLLRNEEGGRYYSCDKCCNGDEGCTVYYITDHGDCYHASQACSGLIRKVRLIRKSEAGAISCCSRCREEVNG